jgi:hypothetical protein
VDPVVERDECAELRGHRRNELKFIPSLPPGCCRRYCIRCAAGSTVVRYVLV